MLKPLPRLMSDEAAEHFLETANLAEYDLSTLKRVHFEFAPKVKQVNMRMAEDLLTAVKVRAKANGIPYQRFIRQALEEALARPRADERPAPAE